MPTYRCPCCDKPAIRRIEPITDAEAERGWSIMARRGWTVTQLLNERSSDLDYIAPGLTDWLRRRQVRQP
jgi:hypothetical protein